MTAPVPTPDRDASDPTARAHDAPSRDAVEHQPSGAADRHRRARGPGGRSKHRHGVGMSNTQRAVLTELIASAPLPPPDVLARLRGYLPPSVPD